MSTIYGEKDEVIEISFPKEKFGKYVDKIGAVDGKSLNESQMHKVFLMAIRDWKRGELSLDELSEMAGYMWSTLPADRSSKVADVLYKCGEWNFYVRHTQNSKKRLDTFQWFMKDVMDYYSMFTKKSNSDPG